jgi:hypothetical protein
MPTLLETRIEALLGDLAEYHGYRTLWLDPQGELLHAEPDDMLEELGFEYVATLMRPTRDELLAVFGVRQDEELEISLELDLPAARSKPATTWYPQAATI